MSCYTVAEVSTRFKVKLFFSLLRLTRLAMLQLAANRKGSCNKARIRYKRCACHWAIWINAHRWENSLPWSITTKTDDKGGNPTTTTPVQRTVMLGEDFQV